MRSVTFLLILVHLAKFFTFLVTPVRSCASPIHFLCAIPVSPPVLTLATLAPCCAIALFAHVNSSFVHVPVPLALVRSWHFLCTQCPKKHFFFYKFGAVFQYLFSSAFLAHSCRHFVISIRSCFIPACSYAFCSIRFCSVSLLYVSVLVASPIHSCATPAPLPSTPLFRNHLAVPLLYTSMFIHFCMFL